MRTSACPLADATALFATALFAILGVLLAQPLSAQSLCHGPWEAGMAPTLLQDGEADRSLGIVVEASVCRNEHDTRTAFSRSRYATAQTQATLPFSRLRIPQNVETSIHGGLSVSLSRRRTIDLDDDPDTDFYDFNYGVLAVGGHLQHEADARFHEQALALGGELRWVDPTRPLLPSVVVTLDAVRPIRSRLRDELGVERNFHGRVGLRGYWLVPLSAALRLEVDGGHFRTWGLMDSVEAAGVSRGSHLASTLAYELARPLGPALLQSVFLGYARGRLPTGRSHGDRAWTVGVELRTRP